MTPRTHDIDALAAGELDDFDDVATLRRMAALYDRLDPVPPGWSTGSSSAHPRGVARRGRRAAAHRALAGVRSDGAIEAQTITFTSSA